MSERYLTILEVSQKQAYIFQSNELKENVSNSETIAWVMNADYMRKAAGESLFDEADNMVYAGGGHTVLAFPAHDDAVRFTKAVTKAVRTEYPGIEVFAVTMKYDGRLSTSGNLKELTKALEKKKSERRASFRQGSFGVEETDANTKKPILVTEQGNAVAKKAMSKIDKELCDMGIDQASAFRELGGTDGESNFIHWEGRKICRENPLPKPHGRRTRTAFMVSPSERRLADECGQGESLRIWQNIGEDYRIGQARR